MNKCEACRYWEENYFWADLGLGQCNRVACLWDLGEATEWSDDGVRVLKGQYKNTHVFIQDSSDYMKAMFTKRDFCCMDFEEGEYTP